MAARAGKREQSLLLAISTPPKTGQDDSVMRRLVDHGRDGGDPSIYFGEFAAPAGCPVDDEPPGPSPTRPSTTSCTATRSRRGIQARHLHLSALLPPRQPWAQDGRGLGPS
jgi:hypothetical protein